MINPLPNQMDINYINDFHSALYLVFMFLSSDPNPQINDPDYICWRM